MTLRAAAVLLSLTIQAVSVAKVAPNPTSICELIQDNVSPKSGLVYSTSTDEFGNATHHWLSSSSQTPTCVFEPGSAEDLSIAMKIIGCSRTPFAVMSGGHSANPGFSSTTGVHISLKRFNQLVFSADNSTVEIGMGWTWIDVYTKLDPTGYNVVGGRTVGPGVGGFTLGGGYSWKTNQFGLTCDTVKSYNVVLPNGTITRASATEQQDLFWALKGGLNRFGVVTSAEFYTHKQTPGVYGGINVYGEDTMDAVLAATSKFNAESKDPRTQVITTLQTMVGFGTLATVNIFNDGPTKSPSLAVFDNITLAFGTVSGNQSFSNMIKSIPPVPVPDLRGAFASFSTSDLPECFLEAVKREHLSLAANMTLHGGQTVSFDIEPFMKYGEHATDSAYPHSKSPLPLNLYFAWSNATNDAYWNEAMQGSVARLKKVARALDIYDDDFTVYPNYANSNTTAEELYGANTKRLREIKAQIDPKGIMELAGGFDL